MQHILIIDDDMNIGNMEEEILTKQGYKVSRAYSGTEALYVLKEESIDLVLLDLMLPGLSGEELLPKIGEIPVIVISAKIDVNSKVDMLLNGAVDYITKPFDINELLARITVAFRKTYIDKKELVFENIVLNTDLRTVYIDGAAVKLTRTEYGILKILMLNPNQVITKSQILNRIAEDSPDCTDNSLKQHISNLRKKLREKNGFDYIEAVWGIGFKMKHLD